MFQFSGYSVQVVYNRLQYCNWNVAQQEMDFLKQRKSLSSNMRITSPFEQQTASRNSLKRYVSDQQMIYIGHYRNYDLGNITGKTLKSTIAKRSGDIWERVTGHADENTNSGQTPHQRRTQPTNACKQYQRHNKNMTSERKT